MASRVNSGQKTDSEDQLDLPSDPALIEDAINLDVTDKQLRADPTSCES